MFQKNIGKLNIIFVVFIIVFTTKFFNYSNWNPTLAGWCSYFVYGYIALVVYNNRDIVLRIKSPVSKWIKYYIGLHLLCLIPMFVIYGQSPIEERQMIFSLLIFLFFYYYYLNRISEITIIQIFTGAGLFIFVVQVFQQVFPANAVFGVYDLDSNSSSKVLAEVRNGLYRYRLDGVFFVLFCLYYYWSKLLNRVTIRNVLMFLIFFASMYLFLTRQLMFATMLTLALSSFLVTNKRRRNIILMITVLFIGIVFVYSDVLFGDLIDMTQEQMSGKDIRIMALSAYWKKIISNPLTFFLGNGHPPEFHYFQEELRLFTSDVGFVGEMYHYGVLWVLFYFYTLYYIIVKCRKAIPLYIRLFVFGTAINSIMIFPCRYPYEFFMWISVLYISSLHICGHKALYEKRHFGEIL